MQNATVQKRIDVRKIAMIAMLSAISTVLMFFSFNVPLMPGFIKMDFSELPALLASFTLGPMSGVAVCFVKNLINLTQSMTGGVGELSNFIIGSAFVLPAGLIYRRHRTIGGAAVGSLLGAVLMAVLGLLSNYFIVYPIYTNIMSMDAILGMYRAINPAIENLWQALVVFNLPFTFCKGLISAVVTLLIYRKLEPVINGRAI